MKFRFSFIVIIILLAFSWQEMRSDDFKVLFVNTKDLKIGENRVKNGTVFKDTEKIYWKNSRQYMRVRNLKTHKTYIVSQADFKKDEETTLHQLLVTNRLSTRELGPEKERLRNPVLLLDTLDIPAPKEYTSDIKNYIHIKNGEIVHEIKKSEDSRYYLIPRSLFNNVEEETVIIDIFAKEDGLEYPVYEDVELLILPLNIDSQK